MLKIKVFSRTSILFVIIAGAIINFTTYQLTQDYAGPITAICIALICTWILAQNKMGWSDFGLRKMEKPIRLLWQVPMTFVLTILAAAGSSYLFSMVFGDPIPDQSRFEGMEGNLPMFIKWVLISWVVGAFLEEMIFRGFVLNVVEELMENFKYPTTVAVLSQGFLFGLVHFYNRGIVGALIIFSISLVLGFLYIKFRRNLWPLILAHGIMNMLSFIGEYMGN
ncbi:CPBP family intramembrane glutamic endopeptidase [Flagellimonas nanhaiensis]|uniref:CPBP family intramembrane metalloprotease n=1 Tax=Flagellimonas nanhaiensis TaxID=2292706 RepID=A0A371JQX8_9FLAO|nr:type II CAAX endopeptidase family protein [Allomuricauda nanhaiensis]RDY59912.1 CPBP family intramembrane metalloprotease [Allomuricauda nanhaiensis]